MKTKGSATTFKVLSQVSSYLFQSRNISEMSILRKLILTTIGKTDINSSEESSTLTHAIHLPLLLTKRSSSSSTSPTSSKLEIKTPLNLKKDNLNLKSMSGKLEIGVNAKQMSIKFKSTWRREIWVSSLLIFWKKTSQSILSWPTQFFCALLLIFLEETLLLKRMCLNNYKKMKKTRSLQTYNPWFLFWARWSARTSTKQTPKRTKPALSQMSSAQTKSTIMTSLIQNRSTPWERMSQNQTQLMNSSTTNSASQPTEEPLNSYKLCVKTTVKTVRTWSESRKEKQNSLTSLILLQKSWEIFSKFIAIK